MTVATQTGANPPGRWTGWWMAVVFAIAGFVSYTDRLILGSLIDPIRQEIGLSDPQLGVLQGAAFALVYIFAGLLFGRLADRVARKAVIIAGSVIWCLGTAACGLAESFESLFIARMVVGFGEATLAPAAVSMLAGTVRPAQLATAIGLFVMGTVVGGPGAIAVSGGLLHLFEAGGVDFFGLSPWRLVLLTTGAGGLFLPVLFLTLREPPRSQEDVSVTLSQVVAIFRASAWLLLPLYLGLALLTIGDFGLLTWSPSMLGRRFDFGPGEVALVFGLGTTVAGIVGSVGGGLLSDRLARSGGIVPRLTAIAVISAVAALGAALLALPIVSFAIAGIIIWTLASAVVTVGGIAALQQSIPESCRGVGMSLVSFFAILLGLGLGPSLIAGVTTGILGDEAAVGQAIALVCAPAALIGAALFLVAIKKGIRR